MITGSIGQILPKFNLSGATAAKRAGRMESELLNKPAETHNIQCPRPELNWRHVDFQSPYPFSAGGQDSSRFSDSRSAKVVPFSPKFNRYSSLCDSAREPAYPAVASALLDMGRALGGVL